MKPKNRHWIAFANRALCNHTECIHKEGYINWVMAKNYTFAIGDIVYLFVSDERRVRFKMIVEDSNCPRTDGKYWVGDAPSDLNTYKLRLVSEYSGDALDEAKLRRNGLTNGSSIEHPSCKHLVLPYIDAVFDTPQGENESITEYEGRIHLSIHKVRERNQKAVRQAKKEFEKEHGRLYCEVCDFDFAEKYPEIGSDFIEAHHRIPIATYDGIHPVTPSDFAMVCSNCHSMLHKKLKGEYLSVKQLRDIVQQTKKLKQ